MNKDIEKLLENRHDFAKATVTSPSGEEFVASVISNTDGYGLKHDKVIVSLDQEAVKIVDYADFQKIAQGNPYVRFTDTDIFLIDKMPEKEWAQFCEAMTGQVVGKHKTYLLRWNPAISSYTLSDYTECLEKYNGNWRMNWSIWDWKDTEEGDRFFMLREGDGVNPGIVFRGIFTSAPYESGDWRGTDSKRHYVDVECWDASNPNETAMLSPEELEKTIPEINWRKGHSGELLTDEQTAALEALWDSKQPKFDTTPRHPNHMRVIDENISQVFDDFMNSISELKPIGKEGNYMFFAGKGHQPIGFRAAGPFDEELDGYRVEDFIPVLKNDKPTGSFVLTDIHEYEGGHEAVLETTYGAHKVSFYDLDFFENKEKYEIGKSYEFALSGMAYGAEYVPEDELVIHIPAEKALELGLDVEPGEKDIKLYSRDTIGFIQTDEEDPADTAFQSPVMSTVKEVKFLGYDFYLTTICICPVECYDEAEPELPQLDIPLSVRSHFFPKKPRKGTPIRGLMWLQGRMVKKGETEDDKK